jgi:hypothetical protein
MSTFSGFIRKALESVSHGFAALRRRHRRQDSVLGRLTIKLVGPGLDDTDTIRECLANA